MTSEQLRREVDTIQWFHSIDLGHGVITPGHDDNLAKLASLGLPERLDGRSVLDIGAWDGFYSFEAERRGAARVVAADRFVWETPGQTGKAGFDLARRVLRSQVEDCVIDVMDLSPATVGEFDLVLFLGVLYHLRHPLLALERVCSVTAGQLILETHVDLLNLRRPAMVFYPDDELNHDPTNWWGPNPPCVLAMLRAAGFREARIHAGGRTRSGCYRWLRAVRCQLASRSLNLEPFRAALRGGRMVFHAWR